MIGRTGQLLIFAALAGACGGSAQSSAPLAKRPTQASGRTVGVRADGARTPNDKAALAPANCGQKAFYDRDGDGISDAVETNNRRSAYADLKIGRCDDDPSRSIGRPHEGRIDGSLNLPDVGQGYRHFRGRDPTDADDWGSLVLLTCVERVGRALRAKNIRLDVGDLSQRGGGRFPPHVSHQNGLDMDVRYVRKDRKTGPLDLRWQASEYDPVGTKLLVQTFFELCSVKLMFADVERLRFNIKDWPVLHAKGHSNHLHIRLNGGTQ